MLRREKNVAAAIANGGRRREVVVAVRTKLLLNVGVDTSGDWLWRYFTLPKSESKVIGLIDLSQALAALDDSSPGPEVIAVEVLPGSENKFPTSHSAVLSLSLLDDSSNLSRTLFIKKVTAAAMAHKPWADRRRTLAYIRTEMRFYQEFAEALASRAGVRIPRAGITRGRLEALGDSEVGDPAGEEPAQEVLRDCGAILLLECAEGYEQMSPLPPRRAEAALAAAARLHAAGWEQQELLQAAAGRLQRHGGSFALSIRNPKELTKLRGNWARFVDTFGPLAPELFARPSVLQLGDRLEAWSGWVAQQLSPGPEAACATIVHGDFKAMNVFLPPDSDDTRQAMLIDFASTGVGYGMADVAMHLSHSVAPADLADGGEERLLDAYLQALEVARGNEAAEYPRELALRHYRLAVVDYGRFVVQLC
ncbi:hypothetical protein CYMTET_13031 [Cymbomonas tetramitiformis]|uniref:Aminoglycoside phosphotransferase domain-containing protein n=1 Tax=Cymbomonas tetramitiformis TaxID=36881 RepID=A0AAE0GKI1_9CHLO|nr:hypothetical protein CYMTET_13031 [Cymbomonas tetramitiformis]